MSSVIFEKSYSVNSINININKKLGLFGILGILQDISALHADDLGVGYENMVKNDAFWVLTRQKLKMTRWPSWQEDINIKTWPRSPKGMMAIRDFEIFIKDEKIGECSSSFMVLNGTTRKAISPNLESLKNAHQFPADLNINPEKINLPEEMKFKKIVEVRNSDLDMNLHVNNTRYSQWMLDAIPIDAHKNTKLIEFDINFISETRLGETIELFTHSELLDEKNKVTFFKGFRPKDQKTVFTARLIGCQID